MKICILCTSYPRYKNDYCVPFMHSWARELAKTEDVTVVTSAGRETKGFEVIDNVKIYRFNYFYPKKLQRLTYSGGMKESFNYELLPKIQAPFFIISFMLKSLKVARKCDVINAHWILSGLAAIPLKLLYKKPIVLTEHGGSIRGLPMWLNKFVMKRVDMITSAHYDMIDMIRSMGFNNIVDIKNFLNEDKFLRKHNTKSLKKKFNIRHEYVVTSVGRLEELKDPLTFIESIPYVIKKLSNIKFIIVGDGHLIDKIKKRVGDLGIKNYTFIAGPRTDVDDFLAISDIFIACSATENCFSTAILEAMLAKVPCIITRAGVTEKYFIHGKDAYLVEKKNPKALGNAITKMLQNQRLRNKISQNSLNFLDRHGFRNRVIIKKIKNTLKEVVKIQN